MARNTMGDIIQEVKVRIAAGTAAHTQHGGGLYWDDDRIQNVLDQHRTDIWRYPLVAQETYSSGTVVYKEFPTTLTYLEKTDAGTAVFYIEDGTNTQVGTANWSVDYRRGYVSFTNDTGGTSYYLTAREYDPDAAAAEIWRQIGSWYATAFDFSTDNHNIKKSDIMDRCMKQANYYESRSKTGGMTVTTVYRSDVVTP